MSSTRPGITSPATFSGERLNDVVRSAWSDVDLALFVVDAAAGVGRGDQKVAGDLAGANVPTFAVVNKIDVAGRPKVVTALATVSELGDFEEIVPVSARTEENVSLLRDLVLKRLPEGPMYYPEGTSSDQPPPTFVAELVREKLLAPRPRGAAALDCRHRRGVRGAGGRPALDTGSNLRRAPVAEGDRHRKGRRGDQGRRDGGAEEIELLFGRKVYLDLQVKVEKDWQRRAYALDRLGFGE